MSNTIFYFTGTGNSLKIAKDIAGYLPDFNVIAMAKCISNIHELKPEGAVGFVFPVYYCGMPQIVRDFLNRLDLSNVNYIFLAAAYAKAGGAGGCISQANHILEKRGKRLNSGFYIKTVDNFILWTWDVPSVKKHSAIHEAAAEKAIKMAGIVEERKEYIEVSPMEYLGPVLFGYRNFIKHVNASDKSFIATESCNSCGLCAKVCPVRNIDFQNNKPEWKGRKCQRCLACLHLCPKISIQYGQITKKRHRYKNPYITNNHLFYENL